MALGLPQSLYQTFIQVCSLAVQEKQGQQACTHPPASYQVTCPQHSGVPGPMDVVGPIQILKHLQNKGAPKQPSSPLHE